MSIQTITVNDLADMADASLRRLREGDGADDALEQLMGLSGLRMVTDELTRRLLASDTCVECKGRGHHDFSTCIRCHGSGVISR